MINLFEMMQKAQGGQAVNDLARQFGLTPEQSEAAVDAILPAFTIALRQQLKNPQAWPYLVAALSIPPGQPGAMFQAFSPQGLQQGQQLMGALFGSPQLGQQIAAQAASATGLNAALMQQMMPAMAAMLTGGAWKTFGNAIASAMEAFAGAMGTGKPEPKPAAGAPGFPVGIPENWGEIVGEWMGGKPEPKPEAAKADEPNMFDPAGLGPMLQRMMERAADSAARTAPDTPPAPEATPAEPAAAPEAAAPAPEPTPEPAPAEAPKPAAATAGTTPNFDAFTRMIETGREVQQQHLRNLQALMGVWSPSLGEAKQDTEGGAGRTG